MAEWISVKDRLPSEAGRYLVAYKLFDSDLAWWNEVLSFSTDLYKMDNFDFPRKKYKGKSGFYKLTECGFVENDKITHWMPLPENPKEIENG